MNLPHPWLCWFCRVHIFSGYASADSTSLLTALFLPAAPLLLTALFLPGCCTSAVSSVMLSVLYSFTCDTGSIFCTGCFAPQLGQNLDYPVSPDNSSYISFSLPRFRKSQFSLSQSTDQFAHLFVLDFISYIITLISPKNYISLKINTFLFPNGFLPSVLQFPHQDNPKIIFQIYLPAQMLSSEFF